MKPRNKKKKIGESEVVLPKKTTGKKKPASRFSAQKQIKPSGITPAKSLEKGKKSSAVKKTSKKPDKAKKDQTAVTSQTAKKGSAKKSLKPAQDKAKKVKKKIAKLKSPGKEGKQKTPETALTKVPSSSEKIPASARSRVIKKIEKGKAPVTKKTKGPGIKPSPAKKPIRATKPEASLEEKKVLIPKSKEVLNRVIKEIIKTETPVTRKTTDSVIKPSPAIKPVKTRKPEIILKEKKAPIPKSKEVLEHERVSAIELPEEYGENELILIAVDPNMIFVDWEIRKEEARRARDGFVMRVFNVPDGEQPRSAQEGLLEIKIKDRVGRAFFELGMPGRKVALEVGYYENGKFLPVLRSSAVSLPRVLTTDELGIALKLFESGIPIGY